MGSTQGTCEGGEIKPLVPPTAPSVLGAFDSVSLSRITEVLNIVEALLASRAEAHADAAATLRRLLARAQRAAETA